MAIIRITNLKLRTIIGIHDWEQEHKQDVVLNITIHFDAQQACASDNIKDAVDYKAITKKIIQEVEASRFFLLERLADRVLAIVMNSPRVENAAVRVDKPFALRFADSVSVELTKSRKHAGDEDAAYPERE